MTSYRGSVTITMSGMLEGAGAFSVFAPLNIEFWHASLAPDGLFSATFMGAGPLTVNAGGITVRDFLAIDGTPFSTPISAPSMPFETVLAGLTIDLNETTSFSMNNTTITTVGAGTFSGMVNGVAATGSVSASGSLSAITSAYGVRADRSSKTEGHSNDGTEAFTFSIYREGTTEWDGYDFISWRVEGSGANPASATDFAGYAMPNGFVTFERHETVKVITVNVLGDDLLEGDEGFVVMVPSTPGEVISVATSAQGVILNDDVAQIWIAALLADVAEGAAGITPFTFTIRRTGDTAEGASVRWEVQGTGTTPATGADFVDGVLPSGTAHFLPGETSLTISLSVAGDIVQEAQESFAVVLSGPTGAAGLGVSSASGLIINDDGGSAQVADSTSPNENFAMGDGGDLVRFSAGRAAYRVGMLENRVRVEGPDGTDELVDVEWLKFGDEAAITLETLRGQPGTDELMRFLTTGPGGAQMVFAMPLAYEGPLALDYVYPGTDLDDVVAGTSHNEFVNLAGGNDAADMAAGNDIVDGGGGSNFLTGGAGRDAFFLDGRFGVPVWSCITDWEVGETLTLWGWTPGVSVGAWGENAGLPGYLGATFFADIDGSGQVETVVTFAGRTVAEMPVPGAMAVSGIGLLQFG
jgi:hypothetical protein